jgi:hypothetical protein
MSVKIREQHEEYFPGGGVFFIYCTDSDYLKSGIEPIRALKKGRPLLFKSHALLHRRIENR